jgi:hypothetical protein
MTTIHVKILWFDIITITIDEEPLAELSMADNNHVRYESPQASKPTRWTGR